MNSAKFGGILCLPTGSGKTLIAATFIRERRFRTLVVVDRISIKHQWEKMLVEYGLGDALEAREIQVSTQQSLWSARQKWDWGSEQYREWSSKFGCVILDECHKAPARTFYEVLSSIPALYRFGLSATPNKSGKIALAEAVLGPVLYDYPLEKLQVAGVLGRPHVVISPTTFEFEYRGTEKTKNGSISRNNYADLCEKLIADNKRNALIARKACDAYLQGRKCLVVSSRIDHLKRLEALVSPSCSTTMLTGREPRHKRVATIDFLTENGSPVVVFSTLASEALDIPSLDTLILAYPIRNQDALRQYVGRIIRTYPTKESPQVHDFHDIRVPVLIRQYRDRVSVYRSSGYDVRYLA
jgi:superfamily II DNA or RNA helicase